MIGIIDSGIGGLTVWAALVRALPGERFVYWADQANCPYGGRERGDIEQLVEVGVELLVEEYGVRVIVVACNTATAAAIEQLRARWPEVSFIGLEPAVKPAAAESKSGVIGVLGTRYTLGSEMFRNTRERYAAGVEVIATAGDGLVELAEEGAEDSPRAEALLRGYIVPMLERGADKLVLACTHYPLFIKTIERIIAGSGMDIIHPAPAIARRTTQVLRGLGPVPEVPDIPEVSPNPKGQDVDLRSEFISTAGPRAAERLAERAKSIHIGYSHGKTAD